MLTGNWIDRVDGVDLQSADDINRVAHAVMELERKITGDLPIAEDEAFPTEE